MVEGAYEVVDRRVGGESADLRGVGGADELCFEGDEDVDPRGVLLAEAEGFEEIGFVAGG